MVVPWAPITTPGPTCAARKIPANFLYQTVYTLLKFPITRLWKRDPKEPPKKERLSHATSSKHHGCDRALYITASLSRKGMTMENCFFPLWLGWGTKWLSKSPTLSDILPPLSPDSPITKADSHESHQFTKPKSWRNLEGISPRKELLLPETEREFTRKPTASGLGTWGVSHPNFIPSISSNERKSQKFPFSRIK